jgi:hypothetical protein
MWREKMRKRAEITAVFLGTYKAPGLYAFVWNHGVGEG